MMTSKLLGKLRGAVTIVGISNWIKKKIMFKNSRMSSGFIRNVSGIEKIWDSTCALRWSLQRFHSVEISIKHTPHFYFTNTLYHKHSFNKRCSPTKPFKFQIIDKIRAEFTMNTEHFSNLVHQQLHEQEISSNSVHRKRLKQENSIDSVHQRLFKQDTVNTLARRGTIKPVDSLDLSLSSVYNHETDLFLNRKQTILQMANWPDDPNKKRLYEEMKQRQRTSLHHPLIIGNDQ